MHKIDKFLAKLDRKQRGRTLETLKKIYARDFAGLDIKKLQGGFGIYRVRSGPNRILFCINEDGIRLLDITRRDDTTYDL